MRCALRALALGAGLVLAGCGAQTIYTTETKVFVNQVDELWNDASYRYVATGLLGSAAAEAGTPESKMLGRAAMDRLVTLANLTANQALVDVTMEQGLVIKDGDAYRVVTFRGDVIEFLPKK